MRTRDPALPGPGPAPVQNAGDVTCETLLPQGWDNQDLSSQTPRNPALFPDLAERFLGSRFSDLGGVGCAVGYPNSDLATVYGWSPLDSARSEALRVTIADEGFEPRSDQLGEVWCRDIGESREECYLFRGSDWFYSDDVDTFEILIGRVDAL